MKPENTVLSLINIFSGSYQVRGKRKFIGFGWESEGWTDKEVSNKLDQFKYNMKTGTGPTTLKEEQKLKELKEAKKTKQKNIEDKDNITFADFWNGYYKPFSENKKSWNAEKSFYKVWIKESIGNKPLKSITIFDLEKLKTKMEKN